MINRTPSVQKAGNERTDMPAYLQQLAAVIGTEDNA